MLKAHLDSAPAPKFVLVEDSLQGRAADLLRYLVERHARARRRVHLCVFEGSFSRARARLARLPAVVAHDFAGRPRPLADLAGLGAAPGDVLVVDSLAAAVCGHGLAATYAAFNGLRHAGVAQVVTVLHRDLLVDDTVSTYFRRLSTLCVGLQPHLGGRPRLSYTFKKPGGKVVRQIEEYSLEGDDLTTYKIEKPDPKKLLENCAKVEVNPETLSTFRIGLSEAEKESREKLVLPYLPKEEKEETGKIFYQFDDVDDWDEEDPDDDLDI